MKIALIGYGKMGRMIKKVSESRGHSIVACITSGQWDVEGILKADVCMEFTSPESVLDNIRRLAKLKKPIVIGTTGWNDNIECVRSLVEENQTAAVYSSNFSVGVNLMFEILEQASKIMNNYVQYDVAGIDYHHREKKDSPSGTAMEMARVVEENMERIDRMPLSSIRCGSIPGIHTVLFDSLCDTISITHEARNREGFAQGAVQAAEWVLERKGLYTFSDCLRTLIQKVAKK